MRRPVIVKVLYLYFSIKNYLQNKAYDLMMQQKTFFNEE